MQFRLYESLNSAGYVGSTASAYGLGLIADRAGWDTVMFLLLFVSVGASVRRGELSLPLI